MGYNIAMVTDFFYPQSGGVEFHVHHLSQKLIDLGHNVIIITHDYGSRNGVRTLTNGLKVYYIPYVAVFRSSTFPSLFLALPILRNIYLREQINIVHGHGSYSNICHEAILHARTMGLKTVFTDHSLFGFAGLLTIIGNKILKFTLSDTNHIICVSHTCKENTVLRATIDPSNVLVIPNAVISKDFRPLDKPKSLKPKKNITIVVISRLFPNKGADLLTAVIPRICMLNPDVNFLVAGDGPKFLDLEQMREKYFLQERVTLMGSVRHEEVRDVMVKGDIYLHPSVTEAFGTVIVEAASCGLYVVTTRVGGIPEVLPGHMTTFAEPEEESLVEAANKAIKLMESGKIDTSSFHDEVAKMYSWEDVAKRTENVYNSLYSEKPDESLITRIQKYYCCGLVAGKFFVLCVIIDIFILKILDFIHPAANIDLATKWPKNPKLKKEKLEDIQIEVPSGREG
ncbi:glycosyltransferase family 4 protein [Suhomyces tanzawaensis NRRL Y-17324]|uniref:Phosphatidylinositol N-acetylglucosaminyltransferase GPI3 subunit n=1 Tax=Suhomyces tanzawaensis NRRL Y-17324 TaxID=984487 RepID=A0A1E4SKD9_9ASCO|nr:glycosyltransferase family 4 protein [Suhomyces tanzawaensis NRRL Y-17324]ODV79960.1 glycosyltransferase family 4 protein [Suhomyces tanzawaensis NRRL Y-17324]